MLASRCSSARQTVPLHGGLLLSCLVLLSAVCPRGFAATSGAFNNPLLAGGADPWIIFHDGQYHYTHTTGGSVRVRKSPTITGLGSAPAVTVFRPPAPADKNVWAPELFFLQGKWYLYYAADDGNNANHRMYVAESVTSNSQGDYVFKGKIYDPGADRWAIDGTVLEMDDGSLYFIWSGWPGTADVVQNLYIAPMSNPWTLSGPRVLISTPALDWEIQPHPSNPLINEGPQVLKRDGKVMIVYSANKSWTDAYCLGLLVNETGDVLNPMAWVKHPEPVFNSFVDEAGAVYGPGHASFTKTPLQTEYWIVYHAAKFSGAGWNRDVRAQPFSWNADDTPFFGRPIPTNLPVIYPEGEDPGLPAIPNVTNGMLRVEIFTAIAGSTLDALTSHVKFPAHPDVVRHVGQFETPANLGDHYGARISGFLIPPAAGDYIFHVAAGGEAALYLSSSASPSSKRLIAREPQWHSWRNWTGTERRPNGENISGPVRLAAGQSYYVEALMKAGAGQDHFAVAWRKVEDPAPASGTPPVSGGSLAISPAEPISPPPLITGHPGSRAAYAGSSPQFSVTATSAAPLSYQWQRESGTNDWRNITGGYSGTLSFPDVQLPDAGGYRAVVRNSGGLRASGSATLRVLELPWLTADRGEANVEISFAGESAFTYEIQASTNLLNWDSISTVAGTNGVNRFIDHDAPEFPQRSYRLFIPQAFE